MNNELDAINAAALIYAKNHSCAPDKEMPDWIITDFKAGALAPETEQYYREKFKAEQSAITDVEIEKLADEFVKEYRNKHNEVHSIFGDGQLSTGFVYGYKAALSNNK